MKNKLIIILAALSTVACGGDQFTTVDDNPSNLGGSGNPDGIKRPDEPGGSGGEEVIINDTGGDTGDTGGKPSVVGTGGTDPVGTGGSSTGGTNTGGTNTGGASTGGEPSTGGTVGTGGGVGACELVVSAPVGVADCSGGGIDDFEGDANEVCSATWDGSWAMVGLVTVSMGVSVSRDDSTKGVNIQKHSNQPEDFGMSWASVDSDQPWVFVPVDASDYNGITFYGKRNTVTDVDLISIGVHTGDTLPDGSGGDCTDECWKGYFANIPISLEWQKFHVPFCMFQQDDPVSELDSSSILQIQFLARSPGDVRYNFNLDDVSFE